MLAFVFLWVLWTRAKSFTQMMPFFNRRASVFLKCGVLLLFVGYLSLFLHECGHYAADKSLGLDSVEMHLSLSGGMVTWGAPRSRLLTPGEYQFTLLAGFAMMRAVAALANFLGLKTQRLIWCSSFFAAVYLVNRLALVHGWQESLFFKDNDFAKSAAAMGAWVGTSKFFVIGAYGAGIALDLFWSRGNILDNAKRFLRTFEEAR